MGAKPRLACGNKGRQKRNIPYVPIFKSTPARMTEPATGASTWASGSQVWNGNMGTFMAKARKNAKKSQLCAGRIQDGSEAHRPGKSRRIICRSNVPVTL